MKTLIQIVLVAIVMGGLSAAGSVYWQQQFGASSSLAVSSADTLAETGGDHGAAGKPGDADKSATDSPEESDAANKLVESAPTLSEVAETELSTAQPYEPPVAVRPPYVPEGDEAGHLINVLRSRAKATGDREQRLAERQEALQLIFDDLRSEQTHISKVRQRVLDELGESKRTIDEALRSTDSERAAQDALRAAQEEQESLRKQLDALRQAAPKADDPSNDNDTSGSAEENANLKKMATVYDSMSSENVAKVCQQLIKNGRTASVVSLLNAMKERQTAKVLATISETDPVLAADLTERLKRLKTTSDQTSPK